MTSSIDLMNAALTITGNNPVSDGDGSVEWELLSAQYPLIVADCFEEIEPHFGTVFRHPLTGRFDGDSEFSDAYTLPNDVLVIRNAYVSQQFWPDWRSDGQTLWIDGSSAVEIDYVRKSSEGTWSPKFRKAVQTFLEAACLLGLNEDETGAERREEKAEDRLRMAGVKSHTNRSPEKVYQRSRLMMARRGSRRFLYGSSS